MNIYSELFQVRQEIMCVSNIFEQLARICQKKCSIRDSEEMGKLIETLENLEVRKYTLERLLRKCVSR